MKIIIFLVFLALLLTVVIWRVRKADAERDLARRKALKQRQKQRQEAIKPEHHERWPVIIRPAGRSAAKQGEKLPEPSMTTIEFKPGSHASSHH